MALDLNATMDALGEALEGLGLRVFDYPPDDLPVPAAVVAFPDVVEFDQTFARGADETSIPIYVAVSKASDRVSRDAIAKYVGGSAPVKAALELDPTLGGVVKSLRVQRAEFSTISVAGGDYLAVQFTVEVSA